MKTGRKISGGKYHKQKKKRLYERKGQPRAAKLGPEKKKFLSIRAITNELRKKGLKVSPQIVKRHLMSLLREKKITTK